MKNMPNVIGYNHYYNFENKRFLELPSQIPHFTDEKTGPERLDGLPKAKQLYSSSGQSFAPLLLSATSSSVHTGLLFLGLPGLPLGRQGPLCLLHRQAYNSPSRLTSWEPMPHPLQSQGCNSTCSGRLGVISVCINLHPSTLNAEISSSSSFWN